MNQATLLSFLKERECWVTKDQMMKALNDKHAGRRLFALESAGEVETRRRKGQPQEWRAKK